jgi:hypothetical protein
MQDERDGYPSASAMNRIMHCLASHYVYGKYPNKDTYSSKRGDKIHKALEISDPSGLSKSDMVTYDRCVFMEGHLVNAMGFEGTEIVREKRFWFHYGFDPVWSGKIDVAYIDTNRKIALVINYKTGKSEQIPLEHNWQAVCESILILQEFALYSIIYAQIQPLRSPKPQTRIFHKNDLELQSIILLNWLTQKENTLAKAGEHCNFCLGKDDCMVHSEYQKEKKKGKNEDRTSKENRK